MAIDFPTSPIEGQGYSGYRYLGGQWKKSPTGMALPKNYIVNPAMQISQQNVDTAGSTLAYFPADQWVSSFSLGTGVVSYQRVQSVTPRGSLNRIRMTVTTAQPTLGTNYANLLHNLEGYRIADLEYGTVNAEYSVLRFGWKSPAGTYAVMLGNSAQNRGCCVSFTVSAGEANTDIERVLVFSGDVTGSWGNANSVGIRIYFNLGVATGTYQGTSGVWQAGNPYGTVASTNGLATNGNIFELFDVGFYRDPNMTGVAPPFETPDFARELRRCQRYWARLHGNRGVASAANVGSRMTTTLPAPMRNVPAVTIVGTNKNYDAVNDTAIASISGVVGNTLGVQFNSTGTAGAMTVGKRCINYTSSEASYMAASARM